METSNYSGSRLMTGAEGNIDDDAALNLAEAELLAGHVQIATRRLLEWQYPFFCRAKIWSLQISRNTTPSA